MVDTQRLDQVTEMAKALAFFLPPPARAPIADKLYALGFRIDPASSSAALTEPHGPAQLGSWRAQQVQNIAGADPFEIVEKFTPSLAAQMRAAETAADREAILAQIRHDHGSKIADIAELIAAAKPEDLEPA